MSTIIRIQRLLLLCALALHGASKIDEDIMSWKAPPLAEHASLEDEQARHRREEAQARHRREEAQARHRREEAQARRLLQEYLERSAARRRAAGQVRLHDPDQPTLVLDPKTGQWI